MERTERPYELSGEESPIIEERELDGGGVLVTRVDGPKRLKGSTHQTEPARIISTAWGERYIEDLLSLTLPALLAPGNIPSFVKHFDTEFVIVTESRFFDRLLCEPVVVKLLDYCDVRLLPIDDLLSSHYGITLTYAIVRGFADLGPKMTATHLCFVCADFIVADGSFGKLAEMIRRGERLVVSPSYCMVLEATIDRLKRKFDPATCTLTASRRELASMVIANRHNTVRAKTINQMLFRIHRYDQFYWYVDESTLLARQLPIAIIYMRPQRVITKMPTFWDYGAVTEYCPDVKPCVLGDSDDFLMAELRAESTARELLKLGWPATREIVADLASYTTQEHHDYGRHTLVVHSSDLPASLPGARNQFERFVDDIYKRLPRPLDHRNHPFWTASFPLFDVAHRTESRRLEFREQRKR